MEKRAIETSRQKMAENELEAEKRRLLEEKRLLEKIETGGGKWAFFVEFSSFFSAQTSPILCTVGQIWRLRLSNFKLNRLLLIKKVSLHFHYKSKALNIHLLYNRKFSIH